LHRTYRVSHRIIFLVQSILLGLVLLLILSDMFGLFWRITLFSYFRKIYFPRLFLVQCLIGIAYTIMLLYLGYKNNKKKALCEPVLDPDVEEYVVGDYLREKWRRYYWAFAVVFGSITCFIFLYNIDFRRFADPLLFQVFYYAMFPFIFLFSIYYNLYFIMQTPKDMRLRFVVGTRSLFFMVIIFVFYEIRLLEMLNLLPFRHYEFYSFYDAFYLILNLNILLPSIGVIYFLFAHNPMPDKWSRIILMIVAPLLLSTHMVILFWRIYHLGVLPIHELKEQIIHACFVFMPVLYFLLLVLQQRYLDWLFKHDEKELH